MAFSALPLANTPLITKHAHLHVRGAYPMVESLSYVNIVFLQLDHGQLRSSTFFLAFSCSYFNSIPPVIFEIFLYFIYFVMSMFALYDEMSHVNSFRC